MYWRAADSVSLAMATAFVWGLVLLGFLGPSDAKLVFSAVVPHGDFVYDPSLVHGMLLEFPPSSLSQLLAVCCGAERLSLCHWLSSPGRRAYEHCTRERADELAQDRLCVRLGMVHRVRKKGSATFSAVIMATAVSNRCCTLARCAGQGGSVELHRNATKLAVALEASAPELILLSTPHGLEDSDDFLVCRSRSDPTTSSDPTASPTASPSMSSPAPSTLYHRPTAGMVSPSVSPTLISSDPTLSPAISGGS